MIDEKIIELMNKEIDNIITPEEKVILDNYIFENLSAREYYNELQQADKSLDSLPDEKPPGYLKSRIINSIDFNLYKKKNKSFLGIYLNSKVRTKNKIKFAASFAFGLLAGFILYAIFSTGINKPFNSRYFRGTMTDLKTINYIPLKFHGIFGAIYIKGSEDNFNCNVSLNSSEEFTLSIKYSENLKFNGIKPGTKNNLYFTKENKTVKITNSGIQQYDLYFVRNTPKSPLLHLQLLRSGIKLYDSTFILN